MSTILCGHPRTAHLAVFGSHPRFPAFSDRQRVLKWCPGRHSRLRCNELKYLVIFHLIFFRCPQKCPQLNPTGFESQMGTFWQKIKRKANRKISEVFSTKKTKFQARQFRHNIIAARLTCSWCCVRQRRPSPKFSA
jgi:hypothetical protein